jgi:glycosyltransferase involved in cell wall biosynthesis
MKIGMYNRWLATLGGGEKYSLTIAEYLSQKHEVHVISHKDVLREEAAHRLNLDLSRVHFDVIPTYSSDELKEMTGEFDLFINASFMEFNPTIAPHSAAIVFFPAAVENGGAARFRYKVGWAIKQFFMVPTLSEGFLRFANPANHVQAVEVSLPVRIKLPANPAPYDFSFELTSQMTQENPVVLHLDRHNQEAIPFQVKGESKIIRVKIPGSPNRHHEVVIDYLSSEQDFSRNASFQLANLVVHTPRFSAFQSIFGKVLKRYGLRFQLLPLPNSSILDHMDTYDSLWAISIYTQNWIRKYWNRESVILYPPIDTENFSPGDKKNQILNVGRFFTGDHNKKHRVMIKAFKEMVDSGLKGWELHLVGGSTPGDIHTQYLVDVISDAKGYPIYIHADLPYSDLLKLYNESAIYWHASGYGEDENRDPVKFEHFGITTVEAMAAGCVPVVIGKGGQAEIVQHGINGFLWYSTEDLKKFTLKLIEDASLRERISKISLADSNTYSKEKFHHRLDELFLKIGVEI